MFIVEVMGHKVGWLTLNAGIAGGADIILIPEIPYDLDKVAAKIRERHDRGSRLPFWRWQRRHFQRRTPSFQKDYKRSWQIPNILLSPMRLPKGWSKMWL